MEHTMTILGIDPGTRFAGYSILKVEDKKKTLVNYGCLKLSGKKTLISRIGMFHDFFEDKINQCDITDLGIEKKLRF